MRSRLQTHIKNQNYKTLFGIIIIIIIIAVFGMKLLIGLSVLLEKFKSPTEEQENSKSIEYIAPPVLNPLPRATKSDTISISGYSSFSNVSVNLYVNGKLTDKTQTKADKSFLFENVNLDSGKNEINAKILNSENNQSDYSQSVNISYINKNPSLEVSYPQDGQTIKKSESPIKITGKSDKGVRVTINDFWAISQDDGTYSYQYNLKDGENPVKVVATDDAGNKTEKEFKIKVE